MTTHHLSRGPDHDEPPVSPGSGVLWVGAAIAALVVGGVGAAALVLGQSDSIANHWIAAGRAVGIGGG